MQRAQLRTSSPLLPGVRRRPYALAVLALALAAVGACGEDTVTIGPNENDAGSLGTPSATSPSPSSSTPPPPPSTDGGADAGRDGSATTGPSKYDTNGTHAFASTVVTEGGTSTVVVAPTAPGKYPVVSLSPGLQQPATAYAGYAARLASHDIITVMRNDGGVLTGTAAVESAITGIVTTWLPAENARAGSPIQGKVDLTKVGLAGHSRGGKASLLAAENGLKGKIAGWFGLDPVDATAFGDNVKARDKLATVGVPIAMIGAEVASSCSPAADTFAALYAASVSPSVLVKGKGAGHTQLEDPATCAACGLCTPAGTADGKVVLAYAIRYLTAFFARELLGDTSVGPSFAGAGAASDISLGRVEITAK